MLTTDTFEKALSRELQLAGVLEAAATRLRTGRAGY
jgi:hypothetical protein